MKVAESSRSGRPATWASRARNPESMRPWCCTSAGRPVIGRFSYFLRHPAAATVPRPYRRFFFSLYKRYYYVCCNDNNITHAFALVRKLSRRRVSEMCTGKRRRESDNDCNYIIMRAFSLICRCFRLLTPPQPTRYHRRVLRGRKRRT